MRRSKPRPRVRRVRVGLCHQAGGAFGIQPPAEKVVMLLLSALMAATPVQLLRRRAWLPHSGPTPLPRLAPRHRWLLWPRPPGRPTSLWIIWSTTLPNSTARPPDALLRCALFPGDCFLSFYVVWFGVHLRLHLRCLPASCHRSIVCYMLCVPQNLRSFSLRSDALLPL